ncbi:MAG: pirin family protein [Eubacterium sp.]|nr:pirin family protein [Eubacterium sp.]
MQRNITNKIKGFRTKDGAGVSLIRVLSNQTVKEFDPILMLDSFDSVNPDDYTAGFPMHPHRGIETISYIYSGKMMHKDSLGNEDTICDGEVQWMTAGSGILHEELLPAAGRMLGVQLWLNLPAKDKMCKPEYLSIKNNEIKEIDFDGGVLRLLAGEYKEYKGYKSKYLPIDYYDIHLKAGESITIDTEKNSSVMLFTMLGEAFVSDEHVSEKTAVKLSEGDYVKIKAAEQDAQILFISSQKLDEPVVWGGPIVMNTRDELINAFDELDEGSFLKEKIYY